MSVSDKKEQKSAYLDAVKISGVERSTLTRLHKISDNNLDKWLYVEDRYPSFQALWELWMFIRTMKLPMSKLLQRIMKRHQQRAFEVARWCKESNGEADAERYSGNGYLYNGKVVLLPEVYQQLGFSSCAGLRSAIARAGIPVGGDISNTKAQRQWKLRNQRKAFYVLDGREIDIKYLTQKYGVSHSTIRNRLKAHRINNGDDITGIDLSGRDKNRE
ncbi:TPA: hypothetical protein I8Y18_003541 [Raoultella ornithinolytica]|nr:hypothetical protein [Raoultella ornithinolytica]